MIENFPFTDYVVNKGLKVSSFLFSGKNLNVKIGDVGKGNVMSDVFGPSVSYSANNANTIQNLTIKSNFIGLKRNGIDLTNCTTNLGNIYTAVIGGETKAEGNVISGIMSVSCSKPGEPVTDNISYLIKNNIFSANINEELAGFSYYKNTSYVSFSADANLNQTALFDFKVSDNIFGSGLTFMGFNNANILIARNFFGTSKDKNKKLPLQFQAIRIINTNGKVLIGGISVAEGNIISNTNSEPQFLILPGAVTSEYSNSVELSHNSFYCNPNIPFLDNYTGPFGKSIEVLLKEKTNSYVSGTTKPGAKVELYYTDLDCENCQPKRYFATVYANANGDWVYSAPVESAYSVMASATLNQVTSEFSDPRIYMIPSSPTNFKVTNQTCDIPNGKIEGLYLVNVDKFELLDEEGNIVGTSRNVTSLKNGRYRVKANQFGCFVYSDWISVYNELPGIAAEPKITHPSCGQNGSITNIYPNNYKDFYWLDGNNNIISRQPNLTDLKKGSYTLRIIGKTDCPKDFGPYVLKNVSGPSIDESNVELVNSNCTGPSGSIKGLEIIGSGVLTYTWLNEKNEIVGKQKDIQNLPEGTYKMQVKDDSSCGLIESSAFKIEQVNKINISEISVKVTPTACNSNTGSIKGLTATGAQSYQWLNESLQVVGAQIDLENVSEGTYHLIISNEMGCTQTSKNFSIKKNESVYANYPITTTPTYCNLNNGTIKINFGNEEAPSLIEIFDENQSIKGNNALSLNLKEGSYQIYFTNKYGCKILYKQILIAKTPTLEINTSRLLISPDNCGQSLGAIKNINITGGIPPYNYNWTETSKNIKFNTLDLDNIPEGNYSLTVTDQNQCQIISSSFMIINQGALIDPPQFAPIKTCLGATVNLIAKQNHIDGIYTLYNNDFSILNKNSTGVFSILSNPDLKYYLSYKIGNCESKKVEVILDYSSLNLDIPNTFTPNGDGVNDTWNIKGLEGYPSAQLEIYNRYGGLVYNEKGTSINFVGLKNGNELPAGVYYYILTIAKNCKQSTGSIMLVR